MWHYNNMRVSLAVLAVVLSACGGINTSGAQDLGIGFGKKAEKGAPLLPKNTLRSFSPDDPARILVIGDSLGQGFGIFLDQRVKQRGLSGVVTNRGKVSSGLARGDFYNWPANFKTIAESQKPDIVVAHFGANDMQSIIKPTGNVRYGSQSWAEAYAAQVSEILKVAADVGAVVYWLGPAPDSHKNLNNHLTMINPLFKQTVEASRGTYMPLTEIASGPGGAFVKTINFEGRNLRIRTADGSHFTGAGYSLMMDQLLDRMKQDIPSLSPEQVSKFAGLLQ